MGVPPGQGRKLRIFKHVPCSIGDAEAWKLSQSWSRDRHKPPVAAEGHALEVARLRGHFDSSVFPRLNKVGRL